MDLHPNRQGKGKESVEKIPILASILERNSEFASLLSLEVQMYIIYIDGKEN